MKIVLACAAVAALSACDGTGPFEPRKLDDWETAPRTHVCTAAESTKLEREAKWCTDNGGYTRTYCYGAAILRNCQVRAVKAGS